MGPSLGGDEGNRTPDPLLAKQVLSQLSYTPIFTSGPLFAGASLSSYRFAFFTVPSKLNNAIASKFYAFWRLLPELSCLNWSLLSQCFFSPARFSLERR